MCDKEDTTTKHQMEVSKKNGMDVKNKVGK